MFTFILSIFATRIFCEGINGKLEATKEYTNKVDAENKCWKVAQSIYDCPKIMIQD